MNQITVLALAALLMAPILVLHAGEAPTSTTIDRETLDKWSAPYRGWDYRPQHVIPAQPSIPGHEKFHDTDVPCVYQLPGQPDKWFMSYIAFNGHGYNSFVAQSTDLIRWTNHRFAMGFGKPGEFDFGGCVVGAYLYESYDIKAPRLLKKRDGKFWTLCPEQTHTSPTRTFLRFSVFFPLIVNSRPWVLAFMPGSFTIHFPRASA